MHQSVQNFLGNIAKRRPAFFAAGARVLELGSRDINGTPRHLFPQPALYVGIDCHGGPGVDVVGVVHEVLPLLPPGEVDVVVSTEMLEHDPFWRETLRAAVGRLRPGGLFALTCAARRRAAHNLEDSPTPGHYQGLDPADMLPVLRQLCEWEELNGALDRAGLDSTVWGVRA